MIYYHEIKKQQWMKKNSDEQEKKNHTPVLGQKIICIKQIPSLHIVLHFTEML